VKMECQCLPRCPAIGVSVILVYWARNRSPRIARRTKNLGYEDMHANRRIAEIAATMVLMGAGAMTLTAPAHAANMASGHVVTSIRHAADFHPDGYEPRSVVSTLNCKVWINTKKVNGHWYAQGLLQSWNGVLCQMKLERRHYSGSYKKISSTYVAVNRKRQTGYHWDDRGYRARVCLWQQGDDSWRCGTGV
jgi:hypothetical protein